MPSTQVAPFIHGLLAHSSMSSEQFIPVKPENTRVGNPSETRKYNSKAPRWSLEMQQSVTSVKSGNASVGHLNGATKYNSRVTPVQPEYTTVGHSSEQFTVRAKQTIEYYSSKRIPKIQHMIHPGETWWTFKTNRSSGCNINYLKTSHYKAWD